MFFRDVQHQDRALSILRRALVSGRTHHAYLFDGPEGVGKELAARALAARLMCRSAADAVGGLFGAGEPPFEPCGECASCRAFAGGSHPDFHLIHRGLHELHPDRTVRRGSGLYLPIDVIRDFLIEPAALRPALGARRLFLVRDAERMQDPAQNALLKTLEEPPGQAALILVTPSAERLLATIRSRCQRIPFAPLPAEFVAARLAALTGCDAATARALAGLSDGRLGLALRWHAVQVVELAGAVCELLAGRDRAAPELFAGALLDLAQTAAKRLAAAATAVERAGGPAGRAGGDAAEATEPDDDDDGGDEEGERDADEARGGKRGRGPQTAVLRDALRLLLMLVGAAYREGLVVAVGGDARLRYLTAYDAAVRRLADRGDEHCENAIRAVAAAEQMLDRNVAPQLAAERLAIMLG